MSLLESDIIKSFLINKTLPFLLPVAPPSTLFSLLCGLPAIESDYYLIHVCIPDHLKLNEKGSPNGGTSLVGLGSLSS